MLMLKLWWWEHTDALAVQSFACICTKGHKSNHVHKATTADSDTSLAI